MNSVAAQEFGSDRTDPYDVRAVGLGVSFGDWHGVGWTLGASYEEQGRVAVHAVPWRGTFAPTIPAWSIREERLALDVDRPAAPAFWGATVHLHAQLRGGPFSPRDTAFALGQNYFGRVFGEIDAERPVRTGRFLARTTFGAVGATHDVPGQEYVFLGGPVSGPGYDFHRFAAKVGASQHIEWRTSIPFLPISLGPFGRTPATATFAPYVHVVYVSDGAPFAEAGHGWYPSVGAGFLVLFDLVRFDVARGLRQSGAPGGGRWTFSLDLAPAFWRVL
jgi:hypothetical protein